MATGFLSHIMCSMLTHLHAVKKTTFLIPSSRHQTTFCAFFPSSLRRCSSTLSKNSFCNYFIVRLFSRWLRCHNRFFTLNHELWNIAREYVEVQTAPRSPSGYAYSWLPILIQFIAHQICMTFCLRIKKSAGNKE